MDVRIDYLANHSELVPILAGWTYTQWGPFDPTNSLEATQSRLLQRLNRDRLPLSIVAFENGDPIGCASLKLSEMTIRPQYTPWLGSMFVMPDSRGHGVGRALVERALAEARNLYITNLYLWTEVAEQFYRRHGFEIIETVSYLRQNAKVMKLKLNG